MHDGDMSKETDELLDEVVKIFRTTGRASVSAVQRKLRLGYVRASRMVAILQDRGIIGPPRGAEPREILVDLNALPKQTMDRFADLESTDAETDE